MWALLSFIDPKAWMQTLGAAVLAGILVFPVAWVKGYNVGDAGRLRLKASYTLATAKLRADVAEKNAKVVAESQAEEERLISEAQDAQTRLTEAEKTIAQLAKGSKAGVCAVPKAAIRAINQAR